MCGADYTVGFEQIPHLFQVLLLLSTTMCKYSMNGVTLSDHYF